MPGSPRRVPGLQAIGKTGGKTRGFLLGHEVAPSTPGPQKATHQLGSVLAPEQWLFLGESQLLQPGHGHVVEQEP